MSPVDGVVTNPAVEAADPPLPAARWLPVIEPHLSPLLVKPQCLEWMRAMAEVLPGTSLFAIEARLASESSQVDLSLRLNQPAEVDRVVPLLAPGHRKDFLASWAAFRNSEARNPGGPSLPEVWLELDGSAMDAIGMDAIDKLRGGIPTPLLCARLPRVLDSEWLLRSLLPQLLGKSLLPSSEDQMRSYLAALGPKTRLLYAFDLSARARQVLRLEIYSSALSPLIDYLRRRVPWAVEQIAAIASLCGDGDRYHLSLDFEETSPPETGLRISRRIGLEISYRRLPHREPRWRELFRRLEEAGLCGASEAAAIFKWPGSDTSRSSSAWPKGARGHCVRSLSHVKLVTWPERAPRAKVYLLWQSLASKSQRRIRD